MRSRSASDVYSHALLATLVVFTAGCSPALRSQVSVLPIPQSKASPFAADSSREERTLLNLEYPGDVSCLPSGHTTVPATLSRVDAFLIKAVVAQADSAPITSIEQFSTWLYATSETQLTIDVATCARCPGGPGSCTSGRVHHLRRINGAWEIISTTVIVAAAPPNHGVNLTVRPVTALANGASAAPVRPAGYAGRYTTSQT
jgi:hypothetical protein